VETPARQRLLAAMVETAAREGYGGATVSRVVARAGVSRATFYEHFDNREQCFLAAYAPLVEQARPLVAVEGATLEDRPRAVLETVHAAAVARPDAARLLLSEALGGPAAVRRAHEALIASLKRGVTDFLAAQASSPRPLQIPAAALLGGVAGVLSTPLAEGDASGLCHRRVSQLLAWIDAYRLPESSLRSPVRIPRLPTLPQDAVPLSASALLPRGFSAIEPSAARAVRRRRVIEATARVVAARGYAAASVSDIVAAARVPRASFYAELGGKREALHAAVSHGMQESMAAAASRYLVPAPWPRRVWRAFEAFLAYVAGNPELARLGFVEVHAAGPEAVRHRHEHLMAFSLFLEDGYRQSAAAARLPRLCSEAIALAVFGLLRGEVIAGRTEEMLSVLPSCAYVVLAPFVGPLAALELVESELEATAATVR
jgi:AcrR family transcriptional regulator